MTRLILGGDVRARLRELPDDSVHCVATSPPYWALRDYGVDGQLGLEATPQEFLATMVDVFREVRRVLRADGTLWVNMGDGYAGAPGGFQGKNGQRASRTFTARIDVEKRGPGLKPKDLVGMPWRLALALQDDGWWLRSDIVPNPMPESATDRPTKAHEYVFLLAKSPTYYFDAEAVKEPVTGNTHARSKPGNVGQHPKTAAPGSGIKANLSFQSSTNGIVTERNIRTVWTIPTKPFPGAHFATFPPELPARCIRAGTSERGACASCGAPWQRVFAERPSRGDWLAGKTLTQGTSGPKSGAQLASNEFYAQHVPRSTVGWRASCTCEDAGDPVPCVVLDPFAGSFTTCEVAARMGRDWIGIELNPEYVKMGRRRLAQYMRPLHSFSEGDQAMPEA